MRRFVWAATALFLASVTPCARAAESNTGLTAAMESIAEPNIRAHVEVLASDSFEGREAGQRGGRAAATYVLRALREARLRPAGDAGTVFQDFGRGYRNIIAELPGAGDLQREAILLTSHYDHVGYGSKQTSLGPVGYIHNGADDNASGVSMLLAIAKAMQLSTPPQSRSLLFVFWDAEEKGLLGAKHWLNHPTIDLDRVHMMVNVDMVGRLRAGEGLSVVGTRSSPGLREMWSRANSATRLKLRFPWEIIDNSDHFPFLQRRIPAVMVHTGLHEDYHRPSDDAHKINAAGIKEIGKLVVQFLHQARQDVTQRPFRPECTTENNRQQAQHERDTTQRKMRLGVSWDNPGDAAPQGIHIRHVWNNSAAERAGLRPGDTITHISDRQLTSVREFRRITVTSAGPLDFVVKRDTESLPLRVALDGKPIRIGIAWRTDPTEPGSIMITHVTPGSPAADAGLNRLDRILEINSSPFSTDEARDKLNSVWGDVDLLVEREGRLEQVRLALPAI